MYIHTYIHTYIHIHIGTDCCVDKRHPITHDVLLLRTRHMFSKVSSSTVPLYLVNILTSIVPSCLGTQS
jgi:hypothetical protein